MSEPKNFQDYVQAHERMWAGKNYPNRPALADILASPVVVFWIDNTIKDQHIVTLHENLVPIQEYFDSLALRLMIGFPKRRLAFLFVKGKEVKIKLKASFEVAK